MKPRRKLEQMLVRVESLLRAVGSVDRTRGGYGIPRGVHFVTNDIGSNKLSCEGMMRNVSGTLY